MAAMTSFHAEKYCHLVSAFAASAPRICSSIRQFLIRRPVQLLIFVFCEFSCNIIILTDFSSDWHKNSFSISFLRRVSIACYAERCISHSKSVCLSACPSVTLWHWVKTTQATIMGSSLEGSPMTLVSSRLTSRQNSKGNIGSEGAEWERGRKNRQFLANKSPYLRNGAR